MRPECTVLTALQTPQVVNANPHMTYMEDKHNLVVGQALTIIPEYVQGRSQSSGCAQTLRSCWEQFHWYYKHAAERHIPDAMYHLSRMYGRKDGHVNAAWEIEIKDPGQTVQGPITMPTRTRRVPQDRRPSHGHCWGRQGQCRG